MKAKKPKLTQEEIQACLERGAKNAAELDERLKQAWTLRPAQWNFLLD